MPRACWVCNLAIAALFPPHATAEARKFCFPLNVASNDAFDEPRIPLQGVPKSVHCIKTPDIPDSARVYGEKFRFFRLPFFNGPLARIVHLVGSC